MNKFPSLSSTPNTYNDLLEKILRTEYLFHNPDVKYKFFDPKTHFFNFGIKECRKISYIFDFDYVKSKLNFDDSLANIDIFFRYFTESPDFLPSPFLDITYIKEMNPKFKDCAVHEIFVKIYNFEILDIHPFFDTKYYLLQLNKIGISLNYHPIIHYLTTGFSEGLRPHTLFDDWYMRELDNIPDTRCPFLELINSSNPHHFHPSPLIDLSHLNHHIKKIIKSEENIITYFGKNKYKASFAILNRFYRDIVVNYILDNGYSKPYELNVVSSIQDFIKVLSILDDQTQEYDQIEISFITINFKLLPLTILSLISILKSATNLKYEIILINNNANSLDDEIFYRLLSKINNIRIISSKYNLSFGEANNVALDNARGKYVCFMNNDAFITETSLISMLTKIKNNNVIGAIGPIFFNHRLDIVEAGVKIGEDGIPKMAYRGYKLDRKFHDEFRKSLDCEVNYISAACLIIRKNLLDTIGGFDYIYEPAYYEDTDLCFRITKAGYKIVLDHEAYCLHQCNTTANEFLGQRVNQIVGLLRHKFISRWFSDENYENLNISKIPRTNSNINIAIATPFNIRIGGGEKYILTIASVLSKIGNITIITNGKTSKTRIYFSLRDLDINLFDFNILDYDTAHAYSFDYAFIMGNQPISDVLFSAKKIFYICQFPFPLSHTPVLFEKEKANVIDTFIVNSQFTKYHLEKNLRMYKIFNKEIKIIYPPVNTPIFNKNEIIKNKLSNIFPIFASIGRFSPAGHSKNHDLTLEALSRVECDFDLGAYLCGGLSPKDEDMTYFEQLKQLHPDRNIVLMPNISNNKLKRIYSSSNFYIHGAGLNVDSINHPYYCEHFGITLVEAILFGCIPLVPNNGGPAEILKYLHIGYQYYDFEDLISKITYLCNLFYNDKDAYKNELQKCLNIKNIYSIDAFSKKINSLIQ